MRLAAASLLLLLNSVQLWADGLTIGLVEKPYINAREREFELVSQWRRWDDHRADSAVTALGFGLNGDANRRIELTVTGIDLPDRQFAAQSVELEAQWQLTEQGEHDADWGVAVELEREIDSNRAEAGVTLLWERQLQRWVATLNGGLHYEWGRDYQNEWESSLAGQLRYRYSASLEPILVVHLSQETGAAGPGLWIHQRLVPGRRLNWQLALLQGFKTTTPDQTVLLAVEFEFY